jgi:tellurite resistance protein TehA-like permease
MNHKFFVLFVGYTMTSCLFSLCLIGLRTWHCGFPVPYDRNDNNYPQECTGWNESYSSLMLLIISVVFFIFTACMLHENIEAIETNASKIARMKMRYIRQTGG